MKTSKQHKLWQNECKFSKPDKVKERKKNITTKKNKNIKA